MPRLRTLKPGFFSNEELACVPPLGRILFAGLWCYADREGRLEDRPQRLKAEILPYDRCDVDHLLTQLAEHGFILRYSVADIAYIQVLKFAQHQTPHVKEQASTIPAPCMPDACTVLAPEIPVLAPPVFGNQVLGSGNLSLGSESVVLTHPPTQETTVRVLKRPAGVDDAYRAELCAQFGGRLSDVASRLVDAENHTAMDRAKDKRLYLRRWLERDVKQEEERHGSARSGNQGGTRGLSGVSAPAVNGVSPFAKYI